MNISNMKNIIVLKDLPSNLVDEAIVFLKSNVDLKKYETIDNKRENSKATRELKNSSKDYIIKEAELVVSKYISDIEKPKEIEKNTKILERKYKRLRTLSIFLGVTAFLGIIVNLI